MNKKNLPVERIDINCSKALGNLELWRHSIGQGGINSYPLPEEAVEGAKKIKPRLFRIFIQEYFDIYPKKNVFNWSVLDPFMDSVAKTGAKIVASICIKPKTLYPAIDPTIITPSSPDEWQHVIEELVKRYSVEKEYVTHWEIGNETDIGEIGGCPYHTLDSAAYIDYYTLTSRAVLNAFPGAKVGGPALADGKSPIMEDFIKYCAATNTRLDFISWHMYSSDPGLHASLADYNLALLDKYLSGAGVETMVTEMGPGFSDYYVEEDAFDPGRAASIASALLRMTDSGVSWTFYYHLWDQVLINSEFESFFSQPYIMQKHWNEDPHRFGMFGVGREVRPVYFVYRMLEGMDGLELETVTGRLRSKACVSESGVRIMAVNFSGEASLEDAVARVSLRDMRPGLYNLKVFRIDAGQSWSGHELIARESRTVDVTGDFYFNILMPRDSVALVKLEPA